jgi:O-antigen ligase
VTSLAGSHHTRVIEGTVVLVLLAAVVVGAVLVQRRLLAGERAGTVRPGPLRLPQRAGTYAVVVVVAAFAVFLAVGAKEGTSSPLASGATRLVSLQSNRYAYWKVAWRAFRAEPVHGVGGGGWAVYWLRYRPFNAGAQDAHSLYIQTAAELGVIGVLLLGAFIGGVAVAARRAARVSPSLAAGPIAGVVVWAFHAAVDWDWEMPTVTLLALLLAGVLLALAELAPARGTASATAPRSAAPQPRPRPSAP